MIAGITGVLLAGGQSRRFGTNKALAVLAGRRLIEHPAGVLTTLFAHRLLITNTPEQYTFLGWPMTGDRFPDAGPLAGIHAALSAAADPRIFVTACDMPLLNPDLIRLLCESAGEWDAVLPCSDQGPEPLCAVYDKAALPVIAQALARGDNRIQEVLQALRVRLVAGPDLHRLVVDNQPFVNINRPADLLALTSQGDSK